MKSLNKIIPCQHCEGLGIVYIDNLHDWYPKSMTSLKKKYKTVECIACKGELAIQTSLDNIIYPILRTKSLIL